MNKKIEEFKKVVEADGVEILCVYEEPYSGKLQLFCNFPIEMVKPAPFQREISTTHMQRIAEVISKIERYIDPIVVIRTDEGEYWTPNGTHRLEAMKFLGKQKITGVLIPEKEVANFILALNTEKAPNLKEKSLEVIKLYKQIMGKMPQTYESEFSFQFEEACFITFGLLYEENPRFSGSSFHSFVTKIDEFLEMPFIEAIEERKNRKEKVKELFETIVEKEKELQERGINIPFVRQYIVSKANPYKRLRKIPDEFYTAMNKMIESVKRLSAEELKEV